MSKLFGEDFRKRLVQEENEGINHRQSKEQKARQNESATFNTGSVTSASVSTPATKKTSDTIKESRARRAAKKAAEIAAKDAAYEKQRQESTRAYESALRMNDFNEISSIGAEMSARNSRNDRQNRQSVGGGLYDGIAPKQNINEDYMSDTQKGIYNYILAAKGRKTADGYLETIERDLNEVRYKKQYEETRQAANENKFTGTLKNIAGSFATPIGYGATLMQGFSNWANGEYVPIDPYSNAFTGNMYVDATTEGITQDMSGLGKFLAETGLSIGQFASKLPFGGPAALAMMSTGAAGQTSQDVILRGGTTGQAILEGTIAGAIEWGTEKIPMKNLFRLGTPGTPINKKAVREVLKQSGIEATEETIAEYANTLTDMAIMGEKSQFNQNMNALISQGMSEEKARAETAKQFFIVNPVKAAAGGALSGGVMAGGALGIRSGIEANQTRQAGKQAQENAGDYLRQGLASDPSTQAYQQAAAAQNKVNAGESLSNYELGKVIRETNRAINSEETEETKNTIAQEVTNQLIDTGMNPAIAPQEALKLAKIVTGDVSVKQEDFSILKQDYGRAVYKEITGETLPNAEASAIRQARKYNAQMAVNMTQRQQTRQEFITAEDAAKNTEKTLQVQEPKFDREPTIKDIDSPANTAADSIRKPYTLEAEQISSPRMKALALKVAENQVQKNAETVQGMVSSLGEKGKLAFQSGVGRTQEIQTYAAAFSRFYDAGRLGIPFDDIHTELAQGISRSDMYAAHASGMNDRTEQTQAMEKREQNRPVKKKKEKGQLIDESTEKSASKATVNALREISRVAGVDIVIRDQLEYDANGVFRDGKLYLSMRADNPLIVVAKHELTHYLQRTSPKAYRELKDYVMKTYYENRPEKLEGAIKEMIDRHRKVGETLTRDEAMDEIVADATEAFFTDKGAIQELVKENRSLGQKILEGIKSVLSKIEEAMSEIVQLRGYSNFLDIQQLREAERIWLKALAKIDSNSSVPDSDIVKYQLKYDSNNNPVVLIQSDIFNEKEGKTHQIVANYIAEHIGKFYTIIESGQKVYIGKDLPDEYTQSEYTKSLRKHRKANRLLDAKNTASGSLGEIVEIAAGRRWKKNEKKKHEIDAKYGFYYYTTRFAVKNSTNAADIYRARLVIRNDADGRKYLYDIDSIKKAGTLPLASTQSGQLYGDKRSTEVPVSKASISKSEQKSNQEITENSSGTAQYSLNEKFEGQFKNWIKNKSPQERGKDGGRFLVGRTSEALKSVDVKDGNVYFGKSKIQTILEEHPEMSPEIIMRIPEMIEKPILILQSSTRINSITVFGDLYGESGDPVMAAMLLKPEGMQIIDYSIISSAYTRPTTQIQNFLNDYKSILYIDPDKNRTNTWLSALRVQFPSAITKYGSIGTVTYYDQSVKKDTPEKTAMEKAFEKAQKPQFSLKQPVEETKDLIALHNLSEEKLMKAHDLGGFPMPSIAITKTDIPHTHLGDISLIFSKETIDPADKRNKVYSADAWTPTFPSVEFETDYKKESQIKTVLNRLVETAEDQYKRSIYPYAQNIEDRLNRAGNYDEFIREAMENDGVMVAFLSSNGKDVSGEQEEMRDVIDKAEFETWTRNLYDGVVKDSGVYNGKDPFTPSGNRKSLKTTHLPVTVENIAKVMAASAKKGGGTSGFYGAKSLRASAAENFKSLEDIRKAKGKLKPRTPENEEKLNDEMNERLYEITQKMVASKPNTRSNSFMESDYAGEVLMEIAEKKPTIDCIVKTGASYDYKINNDLAMEIRTLISDIAQLPVDLFEAKPQRPLYFEEILAAVIPDTASKEVITALQERGIKTVEYTEDNTESRLEAVNSVDKARFSLKNKNLTPDSRIPFVQHEEYIDVPKNDHAKLKTLQDKVKNLQRGTYENKATGYKADINKETIQKALHPTSKRFNVFKDAYVDNLNGILHLPELFETALYVDTMEPMKNKSKNPNMKGFHHFIAPLRMDSKDYRALISTREKADSNTLYVLRVEILPIKKMPHTEIPIDKSISVGAPNSISIPDLIEGVKIYDYDMQKNVEYTKEDVQYQLKADMDVQRIINSDADISYADIKKLLEVNRYLREQLPYAKIVKPERTDTARISRKILNEYGSKMSITQLERDIFGLYTYMMNEDYLVWEDVKKKANEIAKSVVFQAEELNTELYDEYKGLRKYLKETRIKVPEGQIDQNRYQQLRQRNFGRIRISKEGTSLDSIYQELSEEYPEYFDAERDVSAQDQLERISEVLDGLKKVYENPFEGNLSNATANLGAEILDQFFSVPQHKTPEAKALIVLREKKDAEIEKIKKENKEKIKSIYQKERERRKALVNERFLQYKKADIQREVRKEQLDTMKRNVAWLKKRLLTPSDKNHMPKEFTKAVSSALLTLDFTTSRMEKREERTGEKSERAIEWLLLKQEYEKLAEDPTTGAELDENALDMMDSLNVIMGEKRIDQLDLQQLHMINDLLKHLRHMIEYENQLFNEAIRATITDSGNKIIGEMSKEKQKTERAGVKDKLERFFLIENMNPVDLFHNIGGETERLYAQIRKGLDRHIRNVKKTIQEISDIKGSINIKTWTGDQAVATVYNVENGSIELTPSQVMSLYALSKREQAVNHILGSGVVPSSVVAKAGKLKKKKIGFEETLQLTESDINRITNSLTQEQKDITEGLVEYMSTVCADWGNETSMKLYGYKKFTEKNYFPIKSAEVYLNSDYMHTGQTTLKNMGFTKNIVINANNPIVIDDIFDTVTDHINKMSMYGSLAIPITDFQRVYNYKQKSAEGFSVTGVQSSIKRTKGDQTLKYIEKFLKDINGNLATDPSASMANKSLSVFKKNALGFNLRVLVQQPTAYTRAAAKISPKYLAAGIAGMATNRKVQKEMFEHAPIAYWKSLGFYDLDTGRQMRDVLLGEKHFLDTAAMGMYGAADNLAWGWLWTAVKTETKQTRPELKYGTDTYWEHCNERFSEIVDYTQVVDTVFHRSQLMRSQDTWVKIATSFASEPTKTYNMLVTGLRDAKKDGIRSRAGRTAVAATVSVYIANALINSLFASLISAWRDDDDESYLDKYKEILTETFAQNVNPLNLIPVVRDILSMWQGYEVKRVEYEAIYGVVNVAKKWIALSEGESKESIPALINETLEKSAAIFGVSLKNIKRDLKAGQIMEQFANSIAGEDYGTYLIYRTFEKDITNEKNRSDFIKLYLKAVNNGNQESAKAIKSDMILHGIDEEKIEEAERENKRESIAANLSEMIVSGNIEAAYHESRNLASSGEYEFEGLLKSAVKYAKEENPEAQIQYEGFYSLTDSKQDAYFEEYEFATGERERVNGRLKDVKEKRPSLRDQGVSVDDYMKAMNAIRDDEGNLIKGGDDIAMALLNAGITDQELVAATGATVINMKNAKKRKTLGLELSISEFADDADEKAGNNNGSLTQEEFKIFMWGSSYSRQEKAALWDTLWPRSKNYNPYR